MYFTTEIKIRLKYTVMFNILLQHTTSSAILDLITDINNLSVNKVQNILCLILNQMHYK